MTKEQANNILINELTKDSRGWDLTQFPSELLNDFAIILRGQVKNCSKTDTAEQHQELFSFFMWFRENGEQHMGKSIESMINIYLDGK